MATFADVARRFGADLPDTVPVHGVSAADRPVPETLAFVTRWTDERGALVRDHPRTLFLVPEDAPVAGDNVVRVANPRLAYALAVRDLLGAGQQRGIASTAQIDPAAVVGENVTIGHYTVLEGGVVVGDDSFIDSHTVIRTGVTIGRNAKIGSHVSIGGPGFGYETEEDGTPIWIAHVGGVVIGDDVEIGSHTTIAQGTIDPTRIGDHVKIDACVFIAHNVQVGESSFLIAGAEISGSVTIGDRAWIAPEVSIIQKTVIGDDALVGIGSTVIRDVPPNTVVAGAPARPLGPRHP
jgi:UDP-3-O-[3-hydroxymyristoyl] glucosamine N-acyltransferase